MSICRVRLSDRSVRVNIVLSLSISTRLVWNTKADKLLLSTRLSPITFVIKYIPHVRVRIGFGASVIPSVFAWVFVTCFRNQRY